MVETSAAGLIALKLAIQSADVGGDSVMTLMLKAQL
jgi:hypothetical protein